MGAPAEVLFCDDCGAECAERCAYIRPGEQPYFQAYRLAARVAGDDWRSWEFTAWIQRQWAAFERAHGYTSAEAMICRDEFKAWLYRAVGHPEAA